MTAVTQAESTDRPQDPVHHLSDELLLDYAAGSLDEATSLLVASHLTLCATCRARLLQLESLGGEMLARIEPVALSETAMDTALALLDRGEEMGPAQGLPLPANDNPVLPRVMQQYLAGDLDSITWKPLGMGVETREVTLSQPGSQPGKRAFLLRVAAGRSIPQHSHEGNEYVLVLDGSYSDEIGQFKPGDVAIADGEIDHKPVADRDKPCTCLVVLDAPLRLTGPLGRFFNFFVRI